MQIKALIFLFHSKVSKNGMLSMLLACLFFSFMGLFIKIALEQVGVGQAIFCRSVITALILSFFMWRRKISFIGNKPLLLLGRALAGFTALSLNFYAVSKIPLGDAAVLNQSSPIFTVFISALFLGEKPTKLSIFLTFTSLLGVILLLKPVFTHWNLDYAAALISGFMAALAYLSIRQLHQSDSSFTMALYFAFFSSLLSFPWMISEFKFAAPFTWILLLLAGLCGTLGQLLLTIAYKWEETWVVSPISYLGVLFSFLWGLLFFQEKPDRYSLLGSFILMTSSILLIQGEKFFLLKALKKRIKYPLIKN